MKMELMAPKITTICFALPKNVQLYDDDMAHLGTARLKAIKKVIGINQRYVSDENTYASDLGIKALKEALNVSGKEIDALIVASCTPDYFSPKLSNMISHGAKLSNNVFCMDIFGFCDSFITSLVQASALLEHCERIAVVCADTQTKQIDLQNDKQNSAITSDNACAIILEKSNEKMYFTTGTYFDNLMKMSNFVSACKDGDKLSITNNELVFKTFFDNFPKLYEDFIKFAPKSEFNIFHAPIKFFKDRVEKECKIEFFNKSLEQFACLHLGDIPINLLLANDEIDFNATRALLIGHGTGTTISMVNLPIWNFKSKIIYI